MHGAGPKRTIEAVMGPVNDNVPKRQAVDVPIGAPNLEQRLPSFRLNELPRELLCHVVHFLNPEAFNKLLLVSKALKESMLSIGPIDPRSHLSLDSVVSDVFDESEDLQNALQARFACAQFELCAPDPLDGLYGMASRPDVKRLKLIISSENSGDVDISLDDLLPELDKQVASRAKNANDLPPSCELLLTVKSCDAPSAPTLQALKHLKIAALWAPRGDWVPLLKHLPHLRDACFLEQQMDNEAVRMLASRNQPIPRLTLGSCKKEVVVSEFVAMLKALQVKHIELWDPNEFPLETLNSCELESLQLVNNFGDDLLYKVDEFLREATVPRLILSDDFNWPRQISDFACIADGVKANRCLRRLDVKIGADRVSGDAELLTAVLENHNMEFASLPYPLEFQTKVDRFLAAQPKLRIRRTNKYPDAEKKLDEICKAMEQGRAQ